MFIHSLPLTVLALPLGPLLKFQVVGSFGIFKPSVILPAMILARVRVWG